MLRRNERLVEKIAPGSIIFDEFVLPHRVGIVSASLRMCVRACVCMYVCVCAYVCMCVREQAKLKTKSKTDEEQINGTHEAKKWFAALGKTASIHRIERSTQTPPFPTNPL